MHLLASQSIIGLQGIVYLALITLWGTRTLDDSLSRLGSVSETISIVSQT